MPDALASERQAPRRAPPWGGVGGSWAAPPGGAWLGVGLLGTTALVGFMANAIETWL
ncbi:hypothetical protein PATSB16_29640 [Pandoraea thiooxydans]|nr:hypothetical protein PATSB16_29640 [Pandoraea thiooxydans]